MSAAGQIFFEEVFPAEQLYISSRFYVHSAMIVGQPIKSFLLFNWLFQFRKWVWNKSVSRDINFKTTKYAFQTALEIAKRGGEVHLVCRNPASAEEAKNEVVQTTSNPNVHVHILDMSNIKAIHQVHTWKHVWFNSFKTI